MSAPLENSNGNPHRDADLSVNQNSFLLSAFVKSRVPKKIVNFGFAAEYYKTGLTGSQSVGGNGSGTYNTFNFTLHFLNLIIKPEFVFGSKWKFIINSGVYVGILLNVNTTGTWTTYGPGPVTSGLINENSNHYFQNSNVGFLGGFGTEYPISKRILINLEANYTFGITNLANGSLSTVFFNLLNARLSIGAAYRFNTKKKNSKDKGEEKKKNYLDWFENQ